MKSSLTPYLTPTQMIDAGEKNIVAAAAMLTKDCADDVEKATRLFYFVRDSIKYNVYMVSVFIEDFKASRILAWGKGYCVQKAVLLTALGRAAGIPSRLAFAKIRNHTVPQHIINMTGSNIFPRHGYNQFYLQGRWVSAAATFDKALCKKNGLPTVEFDGKHDAHLPAQDLNGNPYIEYLEMYSSHEDLPFDWIKERLLTIVGPDKRPWLTKPDGTSSRIILNTSTQSKP